MKTVLLKIEIIIATFFTILFYVSNSTGQVFTSVDNAYIIPKGNSGIAFSYSTYSEKVTEYSYNYNNGQYDSKETTHMETLSHNAGFRFILGGENTNVGFHYERNSFTESASAMNYFSIEPKFRMVENRSSFALPVGIYWSEGEGDEKIVQLMPSFLITFGNGKNFEFNLSPKAIIIVNHPSIPFLNMAAGFGVSSDIKKWAIRPEVGYTVSPLGGQRLITNGCERGRKLFKLKF